MDGSRFPPGSIEPGSIDMQAFYTVSNSSLVQHFILKREAPASGLCMRVQNLFWKELLPKLLAGGGMCVKKLQCSVMKERSSVLAEEGQFIIYVLPKQELLLLPKDCCRLRIFADRVLQTPGYSVYTSSPNPVYISIQSSGTSPWARLSEPISISKA